MGRIWLAFFLAILLVGAASPLVIGGNVTSFYWPLLVGSTLVCATFTLFVGLPCYLLLVRFKLIKWYWLMASAAAVTSGLWLALFGLRSGYVTVVSGGVELVSAGSLTAAGWRLALLESVRMAMLGAFAGLIVWVVGHSGVAKSEA